MAVPYTTRDMAKKIAEEVLKEHGGGGGGSSYTAGNGIIIDDDNDEIAVDDEVVVTFKEIEGKDAILNPDMIISKTYSSSTSETATSMSSISFYDILNFDEDNPEACVCLTTTDGEKLNVLMLNKDGLAFVGDGATGGIKSIIAPGVVTFVSNNDNLSQGIEFPVTELERVVLFNSIKYQITKGTFQLPTFQVVKKQTGNQNKVRVLSSEVIVKPNFENIEGENGIILFDFNKNGDDYGTTYELTSTGEWRTGAE